jgi:hypothetical protein
MKTYFCELNYFATGEGMKNVMAVVYADGLNEEDAKKAFILKHMCNNDATDMLCISYFSHGVVVCDMDDETQHAKIKNIMKDFFTEKNIEYMFHANKAGALIDFYYKSYANFS